MCGETLTSIGKSRFSIAIVSLSYVICIAHLYWFSIVQSQWINRPEKPMFLDDEDDEAHLMQMAGPVQIKGAIHGSWGWPLSNTVFRMSAFSLLTGSVVTSWILMSSGTFGKAWRWNLRAIPVLLMVCFRYHCLSFSRLSVVILSHCLHSQTAHFLWIGTKWNKASNSVLTVHCSVAIRTGDAHVFVASLFKRSYWTHSA